MKAKQTTPRLAITAGEPAGIGPDILLTAATLPHEAQWVAIGSATYWRQGEAIRLDIALTLPSTDDTSPHVPGILPLIDIPASDCKAGTQDPDNARLC